MNEYKGTPIEKHLLSNGMNVYIQQTPTNTVTLSVTVKAGSFDEDKHYGIAHLTEHMVFKGTEKRTVDEINEAIEAVGGLINAETNFEYTRYHCTVPSDAWETGLDVLCDIAFNATIPEDELQREITVVQEEIDMYDDQPSYFVQEQLIKEMNKSYPNRQSIAGTKESVGAIQRNDIVDWINRFYQPDNMFVIAVGNIDGNAVEQFLTKNYLVSGKAQLPKERNFVPDSLDSKVLLAKRHLAQAHLTWGLFGPSASSPDFTAVDVMCTILGGSMTSRLYRIIREQRGLAYTVSVDVEDLKDTSLIIGYTGLSAKNVDETHNTIIEEFERLRTEPVSDGELERAKSFMKGVTLIRLERTSALCSYINNALLHGTSVDPTDALNDIDSVTKEDIMNVAQKYVTPDNWLFSELLPNG